MTNQYQALAVDKVDLLAALKAAKDIGEYRRLQAVHLRDSLGLPVEAIAAATGFSESHVKNAHSAYRRGGIEALRSKGKGGRYHAHLTEAEEKAFIAPFIETARSGGILEVGSIHRALESRLGKTLNVQVTYNMLHRHGWRKIAPRPHHPQGDAQSQEAFKKTGRNSLRERKPKRTP
jgi:transposase